MSNYKYIERLFDASFRLADGVSVEALSNVRDEFVETIRDLLW